MKVPVIALAAEFVVASAAFTSSFAESAVSEKTFDWIFFAIVGIPFIIGLVSLFKPNMLERYIRP
jgi:DeoR/GlpR family transcriptional regulator of sugar metabolism